MSENVEQQPTEEQIAAAKAELAKAEPVAPYRTGEFDPVWLEMYMHDPFLGGISLQVTKMADFKQPTAYVGVRKNGKSNEVIMGFNPTFMRALPMNEKVGVLKHEMYHLVFQHIFTRRIGEKSYSQLWNWATDMAINSIIGKENLPEFCLFPGVRPIDHKTKKPTENPYADFIANAPPMQSSDYYFEELRKIQEENNDGDGSMQVGIGTLDDHEQWQDLPAEVQEEIRGRVENFVEKAANKADRDNSWGSIPSEIQEIIRRMVSRQIDWRSIVRNFIGRCRTMERNSTIRKINKKAPYLFPGVRRQMRATFACFMDQSGSMSDEDIAMLFGELEGLSQETEIECWHFDTEIDESSHVTWKKSMAFPKVLRTRCGGTDFQSVADFCNKPENRGKWSGIIILTDGYAPVMGAVNGARVLWVITEDGTMEAVRPGDLACQMNSQKEFKSY